ncbi:hypothetical protein [Microbispora sp. NBC_01389]|uniref:hypothetical protein n=1 Tax=Microbispora sp. NBC_01389 TaxID=2903584 RepID=UPI00324A3FFF
MNAWEIEELVIEVAEHLDGFTPLVRAGHPAYLVGPGGARLVVHPLWNRQGRIRVLGVYPDGSRSVLPDQRRHEITVTAARGAVFIAKKIERRLLPGYRTDLAACHGRLAARATQDGTRAQLAETLITLLPGARLIDNERTTVISWRLGTASGAFTIHGDVTATIQIAAADRELTERIADAVRHRAS